MFILIQARLNSTRLPGKVLTPIAGKPILKWIINRLNSSKNDHDLVIVTSNQDSDNQISKFAKDEKILCYRGSLNNVIERFLNACKMYEIDYFIRICGDSPLIDPALIDRAISISHKIDFDIITNTKKRTFPKGQSVELIKVEALKKLFKENLNNSEKEHVTQGFYNREKKYKIINFESNNKRLSQLQLSIDTKEDFKKIERLIKINLFNKDELSYSWEKYCSLYLEKYG